MNTMNNYPLNNFNNYGKNTQYTGFLNDENKDTSNLNSCQDIFSNSIESKLTLRKKNIKLQKFNDNDDDVSCFPVLSTPVSEITNLYELQGVLINIFNSNFFQPIQNNNYDFVAGVVSQLYLYARNFKLMSQRNISKNAEESINNINSWTNSLTYNHMVEIQNNTIISYLIIHNKLFKTVLEIKCPKLIYQMTCASNYIYKHLIENIKDFDTEVFHCTVMFYYGFSNQYLISMLIESIVVNNLGNMKVMISSLKLMCNMLFVEKNLKLKYFENFPKSNFSNEDFNYISDILCNDRNHLLENIISNLREDINNMEYFKTCIELMSNIFNSHKSGSSFYFFNIIFNSIRSILLMSKVTTPGIYGQIFSFYRLFFSQFFDEGYEEFKNTNLYSDSYISLRNNIKLINNNDVENMIFNFEEKNSNNYHNILINSYIELSYINIVLNKVLNSNSLDLSFSDLVNFIDLSTYLIKFNFFSSICKETYLFRLINSILISVKDNIHNYNELDISNSNKLIKVLIDFLREKAEFKISNLLYEQVLSPLCTLVLNNLNINSTNLKNTLKLLRELLKSGYTVLPLYRDEIIQDVLNLIKELFEENNLDKLVDGIFNYSLEFIIEVCSYKEKTMRNLLINFILREINSDRIINLLNVDSIDRNSSLYANISCFNMIIKN